MILSLRHHLGHLDYFHEYLVWVTIFPYVFLIFLEFSHFHCWYVWILLIRNFVVMILLSWCHILDFEYLTPLPNVVRLFVFMHILSRRYFLITFLIYTICDIMKLSSLFSFIVINFGYDAIFSLFVRFSYIVVLCTDAFNVVMLHLSWLLFSRIASIFQIIIFFFTLSLVNWFFVTCIAIKSASLSWSSRHVVESVWIANLT